MVQVKFKSAGVSANDAGKVAIPQNTSLSFIPATIIGTSRKGPAYVPTTFESFQDFVDRFGDAFISGSSLTPNERFTTFGPLAVQEWLRSAGAATFIRALGVGDGKSRGLSGDVTNAGFTVGEEQPDHLLLSGALGPNSYANLGGIPGRTYFLGCFMSESQGSTLFSSAGIQGTGSINGIVSAAVPIIRGILMAPSGVVLRLSASGGGHNSSAPSSTLVATDASANGTSLGTVKLFDSNTGRRLQQFVLLLNGHSGSAAYPNVITASMDMQSPNYITKVFNLTASMMQQAGHYLAANWDIHPTIADLTGTGVVNGGADVATNAYRDYTTERSVFLITSSLSRNSGSTTVPNYEAFRNRFTNASSPWIISQKFHGKPINLFKLHALDSGADISNKYKFIIDDITPAESDTEYKYGTFNLTIRNINDFDEISQPLEHYVGLSLDPSSNSYISKIIGDKFVYFDFDRPEDSQKLVIEGNYNNVSKYVRVQVSQDVEDNKIPAEALPLGFRGMGHLVTSGSAPLAPLGGNDALSLVNSNYLRNTITQPIPFANNIVFYKDNTKLASATRRWGIKLDHISDTDQQNQLPDFNRSIESFVKYYPDNAIGDINFLVSDNVGVPDTVANGILDADRFCNNLFTLENIKVVTGSGGKISPENWTLASYVRGGNIPTIESEKSRGLTINDFNDANVSYLGFQFVLQGGFDGVNIFETNEYNLSNAAAVADMSDPDRGRSFGPTVSSYLSALKMVRDTSLIDMQLLVIPGIREPGVTDVAIETVESRFDSMYIMDIEQFDNNDVPIDLTIVKRYDSTLIPSVENTVNNFVARSVNTTFAAAYFPDVNIELDINRYQIDSTMVPPSVAVLGALSLNDSIGQPWFAPAGVSRGALKSTVSTGVKLKESDLNLLYSNNINPLWAPQNVRGQSSGVVIWGQKTISNSTSAVSRINVRRLLIEIRRGARDIATSLLFETGKSTVIARFNSLMNRRLAEITSLLGLQNYRVNVDVSSTSQSDIENNSIRGRIFVQPKSATTFVSLDFLISNGIESEI